MHARGILNLMDFRKHCQECGALLVTVPGGAICTHCGFELDDPEEEAVLAFSRVTGRKGYGSYLDDDWPGEVIDEVA